MNAIDVIDRTVPELIDMAKCLSDIDKRMAQINNIKFNLLGNNVAKTNIDRKSINYKIDDNNIISVRNSLVTINRLNRKNFESLLDLSSIVKSAYEVGRYALYEFLNDIVPDYIVRHIFFEEHQLFTISQSLKLTSNETLKNKRLNINFESNGYSFSLKDFILSWIVADFDIEVLASFIPPFVKTKENAIKLRNACWNLYKRKYTFENGADAYEKVKYGLNSLFSILDMSSNPFGNDDIDKVNEKKSDIIVPLKGRYQR